MPAESDPPNRTPGGGMCFLDTLSEIIADKEKRFRLDLSLDMPLVVLTECPDNEHAFQYAQYAWKTYFRLPLDEHYQPKIPLPPAWRRHWRRNGQQFDEPRIRRTCMVQGKFLADLGALFRTPEEIEAEIGRVG